MEVGQWTVIGSLKSTAKDMSKAKSEMVEFF